MLSGASNLPTRRLPLARDEFRDWVTKKGEYGWTTVARVATSRAPSCFVYQVFRLLTP
jgi:hypothetical protein